MILILILSISMILGITLIFYEEIKQILKEKKLNKINDLTTLFVLDDEDVIIVEQFLKFRDDQRSLIDNLSQTIKDNEKDLCNNLLAKYNLSGKISINKNLLPLAEVQRRK